MRDFHEMLLINGSMLLALLDEQISHWVAHQAAITHLICDISEKKNYDKHQLFTRKLGLPAI